MAAGGHAVLAGVLPTPAVALLALDLGAVISASHNPPEYNGVKLFDAEGRKLTDAQEEEIEALLDAPGPGGGSVDRVGVAHDSYLEHVLERFGADLSGLRIAVDCANGAYAGLAPGAFERLGATVTPIGNDPDGTNINVGCGATDLALLSQTVTARTATRPRHRLRRRRRPHAGRRRRRRAGRRRPDPRHPRARQAGRARRRHGDDEPRLPPAHGERGIRVITTDVGDRYVLEALRREGGVLGGEQSGHLIWLDGHRTGDGLAAALLLCGALDGRTLAEAAAVMPRWPQVKQNVETTGGVSQAVLEEAERLNHALDGRGRVLVRPSGTEPVVRILAEAETAEEAEALCASIATLVRRELG